jgi:hypothetical protein
VLHVVIHLSADGPKEQVKAEGNADSNSGHQDQPSGQVRQEVLKYVVKVSSFISVVGHYSIPFSLVLNHCALEGVRRLIVRNRQIFAHAVLGYLPEHFYLLGFVSHLTPLKLGFE